MVYRGEHPSRELGVSVPSFAPRAGGRGGHSHHPCNKMPLCLYASTMLLEGGAACCQQLQAPGLVLVCFFKQIIPFHPRGEALQNQIPGLWGNSPPSKNQVSLESRTSPGKVKTKWVLSAHCPQLLVCCILQSDALRQVCMLDSCPWSGAQDLCVCSGA